MDVVTKHLTFTTGAPYPRQRFYRVLSKADLGGNLGSPSLFAPDPLLQENLDLAVRRVFGHSEGIRDLAAVTTRPDMLRRDQEFASESLRLPLRVFVRLDLPVNAAR